MKKNRNLIIILAAIFIIFILSEIISLGPPKYYLNLSPSMPEGIYKLIPYDEHLKVGDIVIFEVPKKARPYVYGREWLPKGWLLMKKVGALPGDKIFITKDAININDQYVGPVFKKDHEGKPLPKLRGVLNIPENNFLPIATYIQNSFDGRYFGPISSNLIRGKAELIIKFQ
jgi:conjugative transfer signal peptidase TraF